jgi:hypothetical protein
MDTFQGKNDIVKSLLPLMNNLRYVVIDQEKLSAFCSRLSARHFPLPTWESPVIYPGRDEVGVDYFMLMNALNFCYWGTPKWTVEYEERKLDGAWGMFAALKRAIEEGAPIWEGDYLAALTQTQLATILRGNVKIPLFEQRLSICREVGRVLSREFGGRFHLLVEQAEQSAVRLVRLLTTRFPSFDDSVGWENHRLLFYKRAQLAPAMLHERWQGQGPGNFSDIDLLTVSADYKLPQVLRRLGILKYQNGLELMVDENRRIPARSREELEIRAATIMTGEMMLEELKGRLKGINSQRLDRMIWIIGQEKSEEEKPYHKTLTTAY